MDVWRMMYGCMDECAVKGGGTDAAGDKGHRCESDSACFLVRLSLDFPICFCFFLFLPNQIWWVWGFGLLSFGPIAPPNHTQNKFTSHSVFVCVCVCVYVSVYIYIYTHRETDKSID
jgi:hypothetical protein